MLDNRTVVVEVNNPSLFDTLYKTSALTIEGLAADSIDAFLDWVDGIAGIKNRTAYVTSGRFMNDKLLLTGSNAYPDDLNIVSIALDDMVNPLATVMPRFEIGGRWFDDIVDNNVRRELEA